MRTTKNHLLPTKKKLIKRSYKEKHKLLKLIAILATSQKTESSNNDKIVPKKHCLTNELQGTDMSSTNKELVLTTQEKGCCMNEKKNLEKTLRRKTFLGKTLFTFPSRI